MMILTFGPRPTTDKWFMLEASNEESVEATISRIARAIPALFRREGIEVFVPIQKRDLHVLELKTGAYLFVRSTSFPCLLKLKSVTGCMGLVTKGESGRPADAIQVEDSYVQGLIRDAQREAKRRCEGIRIGSFVRVIDGETRGFCGRVESLALNKNLARVRIKLASRTVRLTTALVNLLNLPRVPKANQMYYYCSIMGEAS
jgi:transcription antitermination factor NusG